MSGDPEYMRAWLRAEKSGLPLSEAYDRSFIPGVDYDPHDPEEVELVGMVTTQDRLDTEDREKRALRSENERLRALLAEHGIEIE